MKKLIMSSSLAVLLLLATRPLSMAEVSMPRIFSNHMVLQRDQEIKLWGWAGKGESISVTLNGKKASTRADKAGNWMVTLPPQLFGGPFLLQVKGKSNTLTFTNVMIGDVWVCSGQSNMEWIVQNTNHATREIADANHPNIRLFTVAKAMSFSPQNDLAGGEWLVCSPETVADFSAVAYFFGRKLNTDLNVPIGLINTSWGGTNIETWTSWDVMGQLEKYKNVDIEKERQEAGDQQRLREQYSAAMDADKGMKEKWYDPAHQLQWSKIAVPADWGRTPIGNADGIVWYRKVIDLPADFSGSATLNLGPIDDADWTFVNGIQVGATNNYSEPRIYPIESGILKPGKNVIVIKVRDDQGGGGPYGKPESIFLTTPKTNVPLAGEWDYKPEVLTTDFGLRNYGPNSFPSQLYHAMVSPIVRYGIKGAIWYQGESNTYMAHRYRTYFPNLINDWRSKWGYEFPFLWVQLANFMAPANEPKDSEWAELREAQSMTLSLPHTGQAVIIDIGEADDIHPRNKQDVGSRLALGALHVAYSDPIVYSGPACESIKVEGNTIVLTFTNTGTGLIAKDRYGYLKGFAIAGEDKQFVWAKAYIKGSQVVVSSDQVSVPVAVRYAWADNPEDANLYNKEGLPASPFRTDQWKGLTEGR